MGLPSTLTRRESMLVKAICDLYDCPPYFSIHAEGKGWLMYQNVQWQIDGEGPMLDLARDQLTFLFNETESRLHIKRICAADRIIPEESTYVLNPSNPDFFQEFHRIVCSL